MGRATNSWLMRGGSSALRGGGGAAACLFFGSVNRAGGMADLPPDLPTNFCDLLAAAGLPVYRIPRLVLLPYPVMEG